MPALEEEDQEGIGELPNVTDLFALIKDRLLNPLVSSTPSLTFEVISSFLDCIIPLVAESLMILALLRECFKPSFVNSQSR